MNNAREHQNFDKNQADYGLMPLNLKKIKKIK